MAVTYSKKLFFKILNENNQRCALRLLGVNFLSAAQYSSYDPTSVKLSNAMKAHLDKAKKHDEFIIEQLKEYELGKKHLANIMGKGEEMTRESIDEAIEYLFPSGLFDKHSRPFMKPPNEVFRKRKEAAFDYTGRPFHFLFYTTKQNYNQILHDAAKHLEELNRYQQKMKGAPFPEKNHPFVGGEWIKIEDLKERTLENVFTLEYEKLVEVFERLSSHPYSDLVADFLLPYWEPFKSAAQEEAIKPEVQEDGSLLVTVPWAARGHSKAFVKVTCPGEGLFNINGNTLDYFLKVSSRQQVIFPLLFTGMLGKVNVEATLKGNSEVAEAGALRYGISVALKPLVSPEMALKMNLAGLLQKDVRLKERKKPGQEGARRKYTWLKR